MTHSATIVALSARGRIAVAGADAPAYLQNQLTCDVRPIDAAHATPGALCTNKGRVMATFTLFRRDASYVLALPASTAGAALAHFQRMVFRSKVTVEDVAPRLDVRGVSGPDAATWIRERGTEPPAEPWGVASANGVTVIRYPGRRPRFELYGEAGALTALDERLGTPLEPWQQTAEEARWVQQELEAALPWVEAATAEQFLPQFLDLDQRGGLSFTKGCFPGQEVVARTQHLGEVKRRLALATVAASPPAAGTALRAIHDDGERDGGTLVRAASEPAGGSLALVVVPVAERDAGRPIHVGSGSGPRLQFVDFPPLT